MSGEIFIETSNVDSLGFSLPFQHLYLVFRDINGDEYVLRSGPENSFWPFGEMEIEVNVALPDSADDRDGDTPEQRVSTTLDFPHLTDDDAWAFMVKYARLIDGSNYDYSLFEENSNAFIGALLHAAGGTPSALLPAGMNSDDFIGFASWGNIVADVTPPAAGSVYGTAGTDLMAGRQIDETLMALDGDDVVTAGRGNDVIWAGSGDDSLTGGPGDDMLYGGAHSSGDRAEYAGNRAGYAVSVTAQGLIQVQDLDPGDGDDGTDSLDGIEEIHFADAVVDTSALLTPAIAETGQVTLNHRATTVTLQHSYDNPVVVAFVATQNGGQPVNVRVSDVSGKELTLHLQEPNYLDGWHANETVNYLVVEAGSWILPDGTVLEAGAQTSSKLSPQGFETVTFAGDFGNAPVILSQVQSFNGSDFVTTRQQGATAEGFQLTMQEEEARNSGGHVAETLGWVAIEAGSGNVDGFDWVAGRQAGVTDAEALVDLGAALPGGGNAIAALSSFDGKDTAWVRGDGATATGFAVSVEEEKSRDSETNHIAETVDYFAFQNPAVLAAYDYDLLA
ncbi:hypothetical protein [Pseudooceanicola sp.]|uniref:hypothetical protein n=1 Tax=Pseudooceanicola sp. TaxID=1914328 RepID=UPI003511780C